MDSLTLELPWPDVALSPNSRSQWAGIRARKSYRAYAWGMAKAAMGPLGIRSGSWVGPVSVQYTFHPSIDRVRDDDNFASRMKSARDGMADALGINDCGFVTQPVVFGAKRRPACVVVTLKATAVNIPHRGSIT